MDDEDLVSAIRRAVDGRPDWAERSHGDWVSTEDEGRLTGTIRVSAGALEARVFRHLTGPSPTPDRQEAHGPQVFENADEAVSFVDGNLGRVT